MKLGFRIWLEGEKKVFGDGPCDLLQRVERTGSLRRAAAEINMSYSQAWELFKTMEERLGFPLLNRQVGGSSGGGSTLTPQAKEIMGKYVKFREEAECVLQELYKKYFEMGPLG